MDPLLMRIFQKQIWSQCHLALMAADDLNNRMASLRENHRRMSQRLAESGLDRRQAIAIAMESQVASWYPVQAFLTAVANISKALWGQAGKYVVEREPLRKSLGVTDPSPLQSTSMRNNFDHFDERLDCWWKQSTQHNIIDLTFGDVGGVSGAGPKDVFRSYNPYTGDIVFWGVVYNVPTLVTEIERLKDAALIEYG